MNIIYDISTLGSAQYFNMARTGIARAIENTLESLLAQEECNICFSAFNSPEQLIQSYSYLAARPQLQNYSFCDPGSKVANQLIHVVKRIYPAPFSASFRRRVISFILKRGKFLYRSLDRESLNRMDIFHSTFYPLPDYVLRSPNLERFITLYDMIPAYYPQYFTPHILKSFKSILASIRPDDWVLSISESTKNDFCAHLKFDPSRVFVTPLAASTSFYQCIDSEKITGIRQKYRVPEGPYVLSLCTLEPRKNIDHTIRCFVKTISEQNIKDLSLVLVGTKGWNYDRIFSEIANMPEINNRIIVTGFVPDEDLAALYSGALMFVYPSFYEGFGLPPLEAMQCGVPVITSNTSSLPEVVGDAGIMVDPVDADALSQAMLDIYKNSSLRESLSAKSLERAKLFSWEKCAQQTVAAYKVAMES